MDQINLSMTTAQFATSLAGHKFWLFGRGEINYIFLGEYIVITMSYTD